jgi:hypothetical protein
MHDRGGIAVERGEALRQIKLRAGESRIVGDARVSCEAPQPAPAEKGDAFVCLGECLCGYQAKKLNSFASSKFAAFEALKKSCLTFCEKDEDYPAPLFVDAKDSIIFARYKATMENACSANK